MIIYVNQKQYFTKGLEKYKDKEYALFLNQLVEMLVENAIMIAVLKITKKLKFWIQIM